MGSMSLKSLFNPSIICAHTECQNDDPTKEFVEHSNFCTMCYKIRIRKGEIPKERFQRYCFKKGGEKNDSCCNDCGAEKNDSTEITELN